MRMNSLRRLGLTVLGGLLLAGALPKVTFAAGLEQLVETGLSPVLPAMVPLVGAAAGIERLLELGWHYLEWVALFGLAAQ